MVVHSQSNIVDYESISDDAVTTVIAVEYLSVPLMSTADCDAGGDDSDKAFCHEQDASVQEAKQICKCATMLFSLPVHLRYQPPSVDGTMFGYIPLSPPQVLWRAVGRTNAMENGCEGQSCTYTNDKALSADSPQKPFTQSTNGSGVVFRYYEETHLGAQLHSYDSYARDTGRELAQVRNYCRSREWLPPCEHIDDQCAVPSVIQMRMPLGDSRDFNFVFVTTMVMYILSALILVLILCRRRTKDGSQSYMT